MYGYFYELFYNYKTVCIGKVLRGKNKIYTESNKTKRDVDVV